MTHGMVAAPQPETVEAGLDVLAPGGNVMDAAITAALVQTAVDPQMCGVAGFGSMQVYVADTASTRSSTSTARAPFDARGHVGAIDRA